jgi:hypothetical protein
MIQPSAPHTGIENAMGETHFAEDERAQALILLEGKPSRQSHFSWS